MWSSTRSAKFGVAIYNFDGKVKYGLALSVGDTVHIKEECCGWYRGYALKNKAFRGIFPIAYVHLRQCRVDVEGPDETLAAVEDPVVGEVCYVLREWSIIWKKLYMGRHIQTFNVIQEVMCELIGYRRELISGTLTQEAIVELKSKITSKIDWGNKLLNLDLVPRANNEQVDVEKISPVELFHIHHRSTVMSKGATVRGSIREQQKKQDVILQQLVFILTNCTGTPGQEIEVHFFLYDGKLMKPFSEKFIVRVTRQGMLVRPDKQHNCAAVFTDLGLKDASREAYVVALVYRLGSLKEGETSKIASMLYRRPYGCGVNRFNELFETSNDDEPAEKEFTMKIYLCSESEFPNMTENLIRKQVSIGTKNLAGSFNVYFTLKLLRGNLNKVRETDPLLFKGIAVAVKIGFPDVIMPDTLRNDLFLTLVRGEFEKGSKTAPKNVEVRIAVIDKFGKELLDCICPGTGDMRVAEYNSSVFYHSNSPKWNETVRLAVPIESFHCSHVRLEFRHCSRKDKSEKKLMGFAFLKLAAEDSTALSDGPHDLFLYKCDDLRKVRNSDVPYTSLPSSATDIIPDKSYLAITHPSCPRADKELICVDTVLCSTKLTQNADLLGLLKWKTRPNKIYHNLEKLIKSDGDDTVKFLQDILDALFNMISTESGDMLRSPLIFKALVHIFNLMEDERFENFKSVLDAYIETSFSGPLVYREMLSCLRETLDALISTTDAPSVQEQFQKCFKVLEYISKCIVESQILYMRAFGNKNAEEFKCLITGVFDMMTRVLEINSQVISTTQGALLKNLPGMFLQLSRLQPMIDLSQIILNLISAIPKNAHTDLDHSKLKFMKQIAKSVFFKTFEAKCKLLPLYVSQLRRHLTHQVEIKLCANILAEVLASLHTDHQLGVPLKPNVHVLLDGLLDAVMQVLMQQCKANSTLTSHVVSCLASMFKLMDEQSYRQLILRYADKQPLRDFLERMMKLLQELVEKEAYPKDWFVMKMATNHLILHMVQFLSQTISEQYLRASEFDSMLWKMYFHLAVSFLIQPCLQLEQFSAAKRQKIKEIYGDMRVRMGYEILSMWQNLGDRKINFLPSMVGPFLEVTLIPETELRRATLPMFFDMMECEQAKYGNFQQVENELIDKLDIMLSADKGDYEYKQLFNTILLAKVQTVSGWQESGTAFIQSVAKLLERLLDYRNILESEDNREKRMTCTMNLLNFYKGEGNRRDMYIRYIYKLFDLHRVCGNHTEAAFTLQLHAELLGWADQLLPEEGTFTSQMEWQRKEFIYLKIIAEFDKGKSWEYGLPLCETLAGVYKEKIMYEKLSNILQTQAEFYQKILRQHRPEPEYFRVGFFGQGFPLFLRNKIFVYRGNEYEKLASFQQRLQSEFRGASILGSISPPSESVKMSDGQCIQICSVKPLPDIDPCFLGQGVPERVRNFYKVNLVQRFQMDRPFHRGEKDESNEFKTLYIERTVMKTCSKLPGLLRWFEIESNEIIELCPVEVAIYTMECMNQELRLLVMQYANDSSLSINPLTMRLNGVIDAAVQGGGTKYQEAFFTDNFLSQSPENMGHVRQLKLLFAEQLQIVESALYLHRKLVPPNMLPLHRRFEEKFVEMKQGIQKPESPIMRQLGIELGEMSKHSSSSSLSSHSTPLGSNRSSGVYCESFADTSSIISDLPIPEDHRSSGCRSEKSHSSVASWDHLSSTSSLISPEKFKGQRPESGCVPGRSSPCHPSRWQSTLSTSSGELTIGDNGSSSSVSSSSSGKGRRKDNLKLLTDAAVHSKLVSSNTFTARDIAPSTPAVVPGHGFAKKSERDGSVPVLPPKRSQSSVSSPSSLAALAAVITPKNQEAKPEKRKEPPPPIPARNASGHLTLRSTLFREGKKQSDSGD